MILLVTCPCARLCAARRPQPPQAALAAAAAARLCNASASASASASANVSASVPPALRSPLTCRAYFSCPRDASSCAQATKDDGAAVRWKRGGLRFAASAFALTTYLSRMVFDKCQVLAQLFFLPKGTYITQKVFHHE